VVHQTLVPAIREAIKQNEIGHASPYCLSYACLGASGASFGVFQGDTNVNHAARATLMQALQASEAGANAISRIIAAVSQACPSGNPLSPEDTELADSALASPAGTALVDAMDADLLHIVLGELDACIAAAASRTQTIDPAALLYIALWVNMTGAPDTLCKWLAGTQEVGLAPPVGPTVTRHNLESYLQANTYFRLHPKNFVHMRDSVKAAAALLPAAGA
jgi:hypothetical protein